MSGRTTFMRIIAPQAFRIVTPAIGNDFIAMLKDSSLVSTIGVQELLWKAQVAGRPTFQSMQTLIIAALVYWAMTIVFSHFQSRLERRHGDGRPGQRRPPMTTRSPAPSLPRAPADGHVIDPAEVPGALVTPGAEPIVLKATEIEKYFGTNHVLKGCSMTVFPGETITILGRSGSGKSTFLRCLNFLEEPSAGVVDIDGIRVAATRFGRRSRATREQIRKLRLQAGMVFQEFNLFPHLSVIGNLTARRRSTSRACPRRRPPRSPRPTSSEGRPHRQARRVPVAPLRRPAPARRDRPGAHDAAEDPAVRRAHQRPGPVARRRGAQGHGGPRPRGTHDDRGHPRDVVREGGRRPRLLHGRGRVRRDRSVRAGDRQPAGRTDAPVPERFLGAPASSAERLPAVTPGLCRTASAPTGASACTGGRGSRRVSSRPWPR